MNEVLVDELVKTSSVDMERGSNRRRTDKENEVSSIDESLIDDFDEIRGGENENVRERLETIDLSE